MDIESSKNLISRELGYCPQDDVLFDLLTPQEHLEIFYDFKSGDPALKSQEIKTLIADVGLTHDKSKLAKTLSNGNQRKLSVAIALCADSKLVLLDEPTAGMDPQSKRSIWEMLLRGRLKQERIQVKSTWT